MSRRSSKGRYLVAFVQSGLQDRQAKERLASPVLVLQGSEAPFLPVSGIE